MDANRIKQGRIFLTVEREDTAVHLGSGDLPVLATPRVLALMEEAACFALAGALAPEETTVGVVVQLEHLAPTRIGASVAVEARVESVDGRLVGFAIRAVVDGAEVARCTHIRAVVDRQRFLSRPGLKS